jgi:tetratricopeptide (TPR) repeat protein
MGDYAGALTQYDRYAELARHAYGDRPTAAAQRRALIYARERRGETLARMQRLTEGLALLGQTLEDYEALHKEAPGLQLERDVAAVHIILGDLFHEAGRDLESVAQLREAAKEIESMIAGDPKNLEYRRDLAESQTLLAGVLYQTGHRAEARDLTRRTLAAMREDLGRATQWDLYQYARLLVTTPFAEFRSAAEALQVARKVLQLTDGSDPSVLDLLARALDAAGEHSRAFEVEQRALALLPPVPSDLRMTIEKNLAGFQSIRR